MTYIPTWKSLKSHPLPSWFDNAKLGIFIHWGLFSVPAWAPTTGEFGTIDPDTHFELNPYAEWYQNTMRIKNSPTWNHHIENYGEDFNYSDFSEYWKAEDWDPESWADLFEQSGAKYVVLTTMHHEGFNLWPSKYNKEYSVASTGPKRDLVGELTNAVKNQGLKMGLYYSGWFNWTYTNKPVESFDEQKYNYPQTYSYADYAYNQVIELIDNYNPDILWNDIGWPNKGLEDVKSLFAYFYNKNPDGVVNDRWYIGKNNNCFIEKVPEIETWSDFLTEEYSSVESTISKKWEATRGLGYSFGFNQIEGEEETISLEKLIHLLIDVVSKNGNLLINIGPKADGTIPEIQKERLLGLGKWLEIYGESIYDTKPYTISQCDSEKQLEIRATSTKDCVYLFVLSPPSKYELTVNLQDNDIIDSISILNSESTEIKQNITRNKVELDIKNKKDDIISQVIKLKLYQ